jgi:hypothetical protein
MPDHDNDMWEYRPRPEVRSVTSREQQLISSIRMWQGISLMLSIAVIICAMEIGR